MDYLPDAEARKLRTLLEISLRAHGVKGPINSWVAYLPAAHLCAIVDAPMLERAQEAAAKREAGLPVRVYGPVKKPAEPKGKKSE